MDANVLSVLLSDKSLLVMLLAPGLVFAMLMFIGLFYLVKAIGKKFVDIYEKQVEAFNKIADSVRNLEHYFKDSNRRDEVLEITLKKMSSDIDTIKNKLRERDYDKQRRN